MSFAPWSSAAGPGAATLLSVLPIAERDGSARRAAAGRGAAPPDGAAAGIRPALAAGTAGTGPVMAAAGPAGGVVPAAAAGTGPVMAAAGTAMDAEPISGEKLFATLILALGMLTLVASAPAGLAQSQPAPIPPAPPPPAASAPAGPAATSTPSATAAAPPLSAAARAAIDERIAKLQTQLGITAAEMPLWTAFAEAMRNNAAATNALFAQRAAAVKTMTAVENMHSYAAIARAYADDTERLSAAFDSLYASLSDVQKRAADALFQQQAVAATTSRTRR